jgi:hypothetical protein
MTDASPILGLPYIQPSQAQKHVTHNEALRLLDVAVQLTVQSRALTSPPLIPAQGGLWLVAPGASGVWAGQEGRIALWDEGQWAYFDARIGWRAQVLDEGLAVVFTPSGWALPALGVDQVDRWGISTSADTTNRLAVASDATLFTHAGAGHQLKLDKANPAATASLLYQTNWSGRAEMGLAGDYGFTIKVSANGSSWTESLRADQTTGAIAVQQGLAIGGHLAFHRGNILGAVGQASGVPTGAVIERGSNANGSFVRFADGLQICIGPDIGGIDVTTAVGSIFRNATVVEWTYPAAFTGGVGSIAGFATAMGNSQTHWCSCRVSSSQFLQITVFGPASQTARTIRPAAIGRWF